MERDTALQLWVYSKLSSGTNTLAIYATDRQDHWWISMAGRWETFEKGVSDLHLFRLQLSESWWFNQINLYQLSKFLAVKLLTSCGQIIVTVSACQHQLFRVRPAKTQHLRLKELLILPVQDTSWSHDKEEEVLLIYIFQCSAVSFRNLTLSKASLN